MSSPASTAHHDQADAAAEHAAAILHAVSHITHQPVTTMPPLWVRELAGRLRWAVLFNTVTYCPHLPAPTSPGLLHSAAWKPNHIYCTACIHTLHPDPTEDTTCDRCRRHMPALHAGAVAYGPLLLTYGLCSTCVTETQKENR